MLSSAIEAILVIAACFGLLACYFCLLIFLIDSFATALANLICSRSSRHWPTATGRIVKSILREHRNRGAVTYSAEVSYQYTIHGRRFTGNRTGFGRDYGSGSHLFGGVDEQQDIVDTYPWGKTVQVYYHPKHPSLCTLEPGLFRSGTAWREVVSSPIFLGVVLWKTGAFIAHLQIGIEFFGILAWTVISTLATALMPLIAWEIMTRLPSPPVLHVLLRARSN
jgi:hypothetical protein